DMIPYLMLTVGIGEILAIAVLGNILLAALEPKKNFIFGQSVSA
ncbi:MAG: QueT transporter family protein, partial [Oribacterium sp.]|nr:QueT transporter family protein [Oribacterium sp.]